MTTKIMREGELRIADQESGYCEPALILDGESLSRAIAKAVGADQAKLGLENWAAKRKIHARVMIELDWEDRTDG